jgi:hypothetical protein
MHDALAQIHRCQGGPPIVIEAPPIREGPCDMWVFCSLRVYRESLQESRTEIIIIKWRGKDGQR